MTASFPTPMTLPSRAGLFSKLGRVPDLDDFEEIIPPALRADITSALAALLQAYRDDAKLSILGSIAARWDVRRYIANLARLHEEEWRTPAILDEPIRQPIFITGLPRSGTTFLHRMLAEDSCHQALRCWQTAYPYPDAEQDGRRDRRPQRTDFQLRAFSLLSPGFRAVHPVNGHSPQECTEVTAHLFQSLRFDSTHHIPTYRNWLHAQGHKAAYRFHRRFLQHLQYQSGRQRWVLKSPDHVFALDALKLAYPDARIVFLHRDPAKVLSSVAHLTEILRKPFTRSIDPHQIGKQVATDWLRGAQIMIEESRRHHFPSAQVFHLHYLELVADPLSAVERLYKHFGIALTAASRARMAQLVDAEPHGGYGNNTYDGSRHGLAAEDIRHRFRDYVNHFGIVQELDAPRPKSAGPKIGFRFPLKTARHAKF